MPAGVHEHVVCAIARQNVVVGRTYNVLNTAHIGNGAPCTTGYAWSIYRPSLKLPCSRKIHPHRRAKAREVDRIRASAAAYDVTPAHVHEPIVRGIARQNVVIG